VTVQIGPQEDIMRMSVGVGPFRFYSGHSRKLPPPSPAFGRVMFFCAILIGVGDGIYALITSVS
jgi:hypothetical protein